MGAAAVVVYSTLLLLLMLLLLAFALLRRFDFSLYFSRRRRRQSWSLKMNEQQNALGNKFDKRTKVCARRQLTETHKNISSSNKNWNNSDFANKIDRHQELTVFLFHVLSVTRSIGQRVFSLSFSFLFWSVQNFTPKKWFFVFLSLKKWAKKTNKMLMTPRNRQPMILWSLTMRVSHFIVFCFWWRNHADWRLTNEHMISRDQSTSH